MKLTCLGIGLGLLLGATGVHAQGAMRERSVEGGSYERPWCSSCSVEYNRNAYECQRYVRTRDQYNYCVRQAQDLSRHCFRVCKY
jgi:hypothetical protein